MQIGRRSGRNMGRGAGIFSKFSHSSGHINFEGGGGDRRRCTENISRRQCHGSSRIPLRLRSRKWINRGEGFDRERVIYREGLARETFQKTWGGEEKGRRLRSSVFTYPAFYIGEGLKADTRRGKGASKGLNFIFLPG